MYVDGTVYPDLSEPPTELLTLEDKADYVHRVCSAWDFYILPEPQTFELFSQWREVFDRFPIVTSPAYHAFRDRFGWPPIDIPTGVVGPTPQWVNLDRLDGRDSDPCEQMI